MNENITNVTEEVLEAAEEITTADISGKSFGKKATIGVLAVALLGYAAKKGYDYYKAKKEKNEEITNEAVESFENEEDFEDTIE